MRRELIAIALIVSACQAAPPAASPTPTRGLPDPTASPETTADVTPAPVLEGRILFHRKGPDHVERYFTINPDGTGEQALFEREGCDCAHWSADWTQILSIGPTGHGNWSLLTMKPDGSDQVVADPPIETLNLFVGVSRPNDQVIAFQGMDETNRANSGLWLAAPDLSDSRLVMPLADGMLAVEPSGVTPDGKKMVFFAETGPDGNVPHAGDVYVINTDGTGLRQLNPVGTRLWWVGMPAISLSPDGRQAVFGVDDAVWIVDLEDGEARPITARTGYVWAPSWSPTGEWITYTRFHGDLHVIALVRPDGTDDHEISPLDETDEANASVWSPDGDHLLVARDGESPSDDLRDLWTMDLDGTFIDQVTAEPSVYGTYSWAPATGS